MNVYICPNCQGHHDGPCFDDRGAGQLRKRRERALCLAREILPHLMATQAAVNRGRIETSELCRVAIEAGHTFELLAEPYISSGLIVAMHDPVVEVQSPESPR